MRFRHLLLTGVLVAAAPSIAAPPKYGSFGLELKDMDRNVKPGDSFFDYALGTWLRDHPIPADKTGAGYNFELPDEIELQVKQMVESVTANPTSPNMAVVAGITRFLMLEAMAATTPRSDAGSSIVIPPAILTNTSSPSRLSPARFSRTASSSESRC